MDDTDLGIVAPQGAPQSIDTSAQYIGQNGVAPAYQPGSNISSATDQSVPAQPQQRGVLKSLLLNMVRGSGLAQEQLRYLQAQTATANAKLPYVAPEAQADLALKQQASQMVQTPYGPMPQAYWKALAPSLIRSQTSETNTNNSIASREKIAYMQQGAPVMVDNETATLAGQPQLAGKAVNGATLKNLNVALSLKGYKTQDLGNEGLWLLDRAGNKLKRIGDSPSVDRFVAGANARAAVTPFSTVDENGQPTTISNLQAVSSGAPGIGKVNVTQTMGKKALIDDIHGGIDQMREVASVFDDPTSRKQIALALAQPGLTTQSFLQSPLMGMMDENTAKAAIRLLSLKEQAMAMRSVLGAGQGSEDLRKAIQQTIPGAQTPNSKYALEQLNQFGTTLDRLAKGIPNVSPKPKGGGGGSKPPLSSFEK